MPLGLNAVDEMSENPNSYSVDQGHLGAMQISYITKSGTNQWHGNAYETWNGTSLNASDYFLNMTGQPKSSDVVNVFWGKPWQPDHPQQAVFLCRSRR
jgi:hypothetical protein